VRLSKICATCCPMWLALRFPASDDAIAARIPAVRVNEVRVVRIDLNMGDGPRPQWTTSLLLCTFAFNQSSFSASKRRHVRVNAEVIAGRIHQILPHSQVALGGNDRLMAQTELNLFQGGPAFVRQFGIGAATVVGREAHSQALPVASDQVKHALRCQPIADHALHTAKV
jgi:hypothetical protein